MERNLVVYFSLNHHVEKIVSELEGDQVIISAVKSLPKNKALQMFQLGYYAVFNKDMAIKVSKDVIFENYTEITFAFPVWAGKVASPMRQYLKQNPIQNAKIKVIVSCGGGEGNAVEDFKALIDPSNEIIDIVIMRENGK